jgi:hypothetical protein
MLPNLKNNDEGSLTIYIQRNHRDADKESNWLAAPSGAICMAMRRYSPEVEPPSILPPGKGTWKPPFSICPFTPWLPDTSS